MLGWFAHYFVGLAPDHPRITPFYPECCQHSSSDAVREACLVYEGHMKNKPITLTSLKAKKPDIHPAARSVTAQLALTTRYATKIGSDMPHLKGLGFRV